MQECILSNLGMISAICAAYIVLYMVYHLRPEDLSRQVLEMFMKARFLSWLGNKYIRAIHCEMKAIINRQASSS